MQVVGLTLRVSSAHRTDPGLARPILGHLSHPDPSTKTPILLPILTGNCRWNQYWVIFHTRTQVQRPQFCCLFWLAIVDGTNIGSSFITPNLLFSHFLLETPINTNLPPTFTLTPRPESTKPRPNFVCKAVDVGETCTCAMYKCTWWVQWQR